MLKLLLLIIPLCFSCSTKRVERDFPLRSCLFYKNMTAYVLDKDLVNYTLFANINGYHYVFKETRKMLIEEALPIECQPINLQGLEKVLDSFH